MRPALRGGAGVEQGPPEKRKYRLYGHVTVQDNLSPCVPPLTLALVSAKPFHQLSEAPHLFPNKGPFRLRTRSSPRTGCEAVHLPPSHCTLRPTKALALPIGTSGSTCSGVTRVPPLVIHISRDSTANDTSTFWRGSLFNLALFLDSESCFAS